MGARDDDWVVPQEADDWVTPEGSAPAEIKPAIGDALGAAAVALPEVVPGPVENATSLTASPLAPGPPAHAAPIDFGHFLSGATPTYQPPHQPSPSAIPEHLRVTPSITDPVEPGNIDLANRPRVQNPDGTVSTIRSMGINDGKHEVLIPTVSEDGRIMSNDEAVATYRSTGRHLGKFNTPEESNAFAEKLHQQQADMVAADVNVSGKSTDIPPLQLPAGPAGQAIDELGLSGKNDMVPTEKASLLAQALEGLSPKAPSGVGLRLPAYLGNMRAKGGEDLTVGMDESGAPKVYDKGYKEAPFSESLASLPDRFSLATAAVPPQAKLVWGESRIDNAGLRITDLEARIKNFDKPVDPNSPESFRKAVERSTLPELKAELDRAHEERRALVEETLPGLDQVKRELAIVGQATAEATPKKEGVAGQVAGAVAQSAAPLLAGALTLAITRNPALAAEVGGELGGIQQGLSDYAEASKQNVPVEKKQFLSIVNGLIERFGDALEIKALSKEGKGLLERVFAGMATSAPTEFVQEFTQNVNQMLVYDERMTVADAFKAGLVAMGAGAVMGAGAAPIYHLLQPGSPAETFRRGLDSRETTGESRAKTTETSQSARQEPPPAGPAGGEGVQGKDVGGAQGRIEPTLSQTLRDVSEPRNEPFVGRLPPVNEVSRSPGEPGLREPHLTDEGIRAGQALGVEQPKGETLSGELTKLLKGKVASNPYADEEQRLFEEDMMWEQHAGYGKYAGSHPNDDMSGDLGRTAADTRGIKEGDALGVESKGVRESKENLAKYGFAVTGDRITGAPAAIDTTQKLHGLVTRTANQVAGQHAVKEDANWYEDAGKEIAKLGVDDPALLEKIVRVLAKMSGADTVAGNTTQMIKAAYQIARGDKVVASRFPNMLGKTIDGILNAKTLDTSVPGVDDKIMNFYRNLHDPAFGENKYPDAVTIDRHMYRRLFNEEEKQSGGSRQYAFGMRVVQMATAKYNATHGTNLLPRQVQALLWGVQKNEISGKPGPYSKAENYPPLIQERTFNVTAEAVPSKKLATGKAITALTAKERKDFTAAAHNIIREGGKDHLAEKLGIALHSAQYSTGAYEGSIQPNVVTGIVEEGGKNAWSPKRASAYAAAWQYIYRQDSVPWFRADPNLKVKPKGPTAAGVRLVFHDQLTPEHEQEFFDALRAALGEGAGYTKVSPDTIALINFRGEDGTPFAMSDVEFNNKINRLMETKGEELGIKKHALFGAQTEYIEHDWEKDPQGQAIERRLGEAGRSDIQNWLRDRQKDADALASKHAGVSEGQALGVEEDVAPPFYSALARALEHVGQNAAPASQWKGIIANLKGVTKAEIAATELNEWLDVQEGKLTKQQILDFVNANGVRVITQVVAQDHDPAYDPERDDSEKPIASKLFDYADYQLPGGSNHRVIILQLPLKRLPGETFGNRQGRQFTGGHFPVHNTIAHIRLNDRTDARGRRVLFVEEIQSDWAQKGKKEGFRGQGDTTGWVATHGPGDPASGPVWEVRDANGRWVLGVPRSSAKSAEEAIRRASDQRSNRVPSAPFVTNTEAWVTLALKRTLRYAAEEGYDSVAFVNGEQSAERYDLSKQISALRWVDEGKGKTTLHIDTIEKGTYEQAEVPDQRLDEHVGKELAQRIIKAKASGASHDEFTGLDLKVGGEGMKAFYDKIVPAAMNRVLAKVSGGKLGEVTVPVSAQPTVSPKYSFRMEVDGYLVAVPRERGGFDYTGTLYQTRPEAVAAAAEWSKAHGVSATQPGFDITPEVRESVMQGQPLFVRDALPKGKSTLFTIDEIAAHTTDEMLPEVYDRGYKFPNNAKDKFRLLPSQLKVLSGVMSDLYDAGMPKNFLQGIDSFYTYGSKYSAGPQAQFIVGQAWVGLREDHFDWAIAHPGDLGHAQAIRGWIAHEIFHSVDNTGAKEFISASSPRLGYFYHNGQATAMGDLMTEAMEVFKDPEATLDTAGMPNDQHLVKDHVAYPLDYLPVWGKDQIQVELFAQMGRLYLTNPSIMERTLPKWFAMMKEFIDAAISTDSIAESRRALSQALRSRTPAGADIRGGLARGPAEGVRPDGGSLGVGESGTRVVSQSTGGRGADVSLYIDGKAPEKYAGNINLDRIEQPEDIKRLIYQTAQEFAPEIERARRGEISHEETKKLAAALGMTPEMLLERHEGRAFNSEEAYAARSILVNSAVQTRAAAEKAQGGSEADIAAWMAAVHKHAAIEAQVAGIAAEAGRALNQFRILAQALAASGVKQGAATQALKEIGDAGVAAGKEVATTTAASKGGPAAGQSVGEIIERAGGIDSLRKVAQTMAEATDMETINAGARAAARTTKANPWLEAWKAMLLTGPRTHATNMLSNSLVIGLRVPERTVAGILGTLHGGSSLAEPLGELVGFALGGPKALMMAARALISGQMVGAAQEAVHVPAISSQNLGYTGAMGKFVDVAGNIIRLPFRMLSAEDQLFRTVNEEMERYAIAARAGSVQKMHDVLNHPTPAQAKQIEQAGLYYTFNKELGETGKKLQLLLNSPGGGRWFQLIMPFVRTPLNIVKFAGERTPFALASKAVRAEIMAGGSRADMALAKIVVGSSIAYWAYSMAAAGLITGGGDPDKEKKRLRREAGIPDYGWKIGDTWYIYRRLEPMGMIIGTSADMYEIDRYLKQDEKERLASMLSMAIAQNLTSKTFLKGISDFVNATGDPDRYGASYAGQYAGSLIPSFLAQYAGVEDDVAREAYTLAEQMKRRLPGQRATLQPKVDTWGQNVPSQGYLGPDYLSPVGMEKESSDPVRKEVVSLGLKIGLPGKEVQGVKLTPEQITQYRRLAGQLAYQGVHVLVTSPGYPGLPEWAKRDAIKMVVEQSHAAAAGAMVVSIGPQKVIDQKLKAYK